MWNLNQVLDNQVFFVFALDFYATAPEKLGEFIVHQNRKTSHKLKKVMKRSDKTSFSTLSCDQNWFVVQIFGSELQNQP
jgi:hypothetical protein